jgi:hypothetical protein
MKFSLKYLLIIHELRKKLSLKKFEEYKNYAKIKISKIFLAMLPHEMTPNFFYIRSFIRC